MKWQTLTDYDLLTGTRVVGDVDATFEGLVHCFGEPLFPERTKITAEWIVQFENSLIASIYCYGAPKQESNWLIGSRDKEASEWVRKILASATNFKFA